MSLALSNPTKANRRLRFNAAANDPRRVRNWCLILFFFVSSTVLVGPGSIFGCVLVLATMVGLLRLLFVAHRWHERILIEWEGRAHDPY